MVEKAETSISPSDFLKELCDNLLVQEGVDAELANILKTHILTESSAPTCVASAKTEISALAEKRAAPPKSAKGGVSSG